MLLELLRDKEEEEEDAGVGVALALSGEHTMTKRLKTNGCHCTNLTGKRWTIIEIACRRAIDQIQIVSGMQSSREARRVPSQLKVISETPTFRLVSTDWGGQHGIFTGFDTSASFSLGKVLAVERVPVSDKLESYSCVFHR